MPWEMLAWIRDTKSSHLTHFSFALAKDRVRGASPGLASRNRALGDFGIATRVINTSPDLTGVLPDPVLHILGPGRFKLLLADGAWSVAESGIVGCPNPWLLRFLLGAFIARGSFGDSLGVCGAILVSCFARLDPIL